MRYLKFPSILLIAMILMSMSAFTQSSEKLPPIKVKEYKLRNGLTVLLHEDHSTPIVMVNVLYHVGSKNESPGRTGFAHLFEHMMFQGSKNYQSDYLGAVQEMGANVNGNTTEDRTFYYEVVPSNFLERALYLEADRMGGLLDAMDQAKLDNQRDVVKNERRRAVDNVPYGTMDERINEIMYPEGHPYHWSVIGSMDDLSAASLEDVKSFFRQFYVPNNSVLALSGDFSEKQAKAWIEKYFGPIKAGNPISQPNPAQPQLSGIVRKQYEDPFARDPRLAHVWPSGKQYTVDEAPLNILASILSSGRGSRLQSTLLYKNELVSNIGAGNSTGEAGGLFQITATVRPGKTLDEVEQQINTEVERIKREGVSADEVGRAVTQRDAQAIYGLQTVQGKGTRLSSYYTYLGRPDYFQTDIDRYRKVTPDDVKRVANQYLTSNHLAMSYVPAKTPPAPGRIDAPTSVSSKKNDPATFAKQVAMLPKAGPDPKFSLPAIEKIKLSNGLNVWVVKHHELPIVSMNLVINAGASVESPDKAGVSSMTASMLNQGTKTRSATDISFGLQSIGANLNSAATWDSTSVSVQTLTKDLDKALDIYADTLVNPSFPDAEFRSLKGRTLNSFRQRKTNATSVAGVVFDKLLYGEQAYGRQLNGDEMTVQSLGRDDVQRFYDSYYRPGNSTLIVVGDVQVADIKAKLEKALANWKPADVRIAGFAEQRMVAKPGIYFVDKPGAVQSLVTIGQVGIERTNPDYFAVQVMNSILGSGGSGRLFMNLREDKGYTYGASSRFAYRKGAGPFSASSEVQTGSTKESVVEFMKELNGIRGTIPVTRVELEANKQALIRRYPATFETIWSLTQGQIIGGISGQLANIVTYNLPDSYFNDYISKVNAVTLADINRVANKYLEPSKMAIVIVGDRKVVEPGLLQLGIPITMLDTDGNPVTK